ncbi:type II toxin-antitoxin system RelE/ParE family toxin [Yaniella halotolerans]|uniref:type II toxin-antitoxin system RelE/ParE family toxin n=1 Tax=Yaniella halotolerans TaxID=225453 RepID=UPI0003B68874|nr:type II toxin-antitoxin system RelE/ParE family toxin [Yaniella halotolerans]
MSRRVVTTRRTDEDIAWTIDHYLGQGVPEAAMGFVDALEEVKTIIGEHPQLGSIRIGIEIGIPEMRTVALKKFPYLAFYTYEVEVVRIHRVLHTARDIPVEFFSS